MRRQGGKSSLLEASFVLSVLAVSWGCGGTNRADGAKAHGKTGVGGSESGGSAGSSRGGNAGTGGDVSQGGIGGDVSGGGEPSGGDSGDDGGLGGAFRCVRDSGIPLPDPMDPPSDCEETSNPAFNLADYGCITSSEPGDGGADSAAWVFDDNTGTTWSASSATPWIGYEFKDGEAYAVVAYTVTSAGDVDDRSSDPAAWELQGSNVDRPREVDWTTLDTRVGESFAGRYDTHTYSFENEESFRRYRFLVTENGGSAGFRIAEIELFAAGTPVINVDSSVEGTGDNQFAFSGLWYGRTNDPTSGRYHGSTSWSSTEGETFALTFVGSQVRLFGVFAPHHGIVAFAVDGGEDTEVDQYGVDTVFNQLQYTSIKLCPGRHVVSGRVTGQRNPAATDMYSSIDRAQVIP